MPCEAGNVKNNLVREFGSVDAFRNESEQLRSEITGEDPTKVSLTPEQVEALRLSGYMVLTPENSDKFRMILRDLEIRVTRSLERNGGNPDQVIGGKLSEIENFCCGNTVSPKERRKIIRRALEHIAADRIVAISDLVKHIVSPMLNELRVLAFPYRTPAVATCCEATEEPKDNWPPLKEVREILDIPGIEEDGDQSQSDA